MKRVPRDDGHHDVELELTGFASERHRLVAADNLKEDLIHHFGHRRIHFPGIMEEPGCTAGSTISSSPAAVPS